MIDARWAILLGPTKRPGVGTWYHYVLNYLGPAPITGGIQVLIDGAEAGRFNTRNFINGMPYTLGPGRAALGKKYIEYNNWYNSMDIDELYFYNTALSVDQVQSLMVM